MQCGNAIGGYERNNDLSIGRTLVSFSSLLRPLIETGLRMAVLTKGRTETISVERDFVWEVVRADASGMAVAGS